LAYARGLGKGDYVDTLEGGRIVIRRADGSHLMEELSLGQFARLEAERDKFWLAHPALSRKVDEMKALPKPNSTSYHQISWV
jgi:hypothetical protein